MKKPKRIDPLYTPAELVEVLDKLKSIYDNWFNSTTKPKQSYVNYTVTELHKKGYKIVKLED